MTSIINGKDTLIYDCGWYAYNLRNETSATHTRINEGADPKAIPIIAIGSELDFTGRILSFN